MSDSQPAITAEEYATWLLPGAALDLLAHLGNTSAKNSIVMRLRSGLLRAVPETLVSKYQGKEKRFVRPLIGAGFWNDVGNQIHAHGFWISGDAVMEVRHPDQRHDPMTSSKIEVSLFQVRFDPAVLRPLTRTGSDLASQIGVIGRPQPEAIKRISKGGRPPKAFWDDLWLAMFRKIHVEGLKYQTQADLAGC